jgi:hypothetical protein
MDLNRKQQSALVLAGLLLIISVLQFGETVSAVHSWWQVGHPTVSDFVVAHWWTHYTVASGMFAPFWLVCVLIALSLSRHRPLLAIVILSLFLILEPLSCISALSVVTGSEGFLGLEELPFAGAERAADWNHLAKLAAQLKRVGDDSGVFPTSEPSLRAAIGNIAFETSPYEQNGKELTFDIRFVLNQGTPYATAPEMPGIVYYAVNPTGKQFVLTISGLNAPVGDRPSMMKAEAFVGEKQPWGGLLATEETLYQR